jgi:hypothetical protein
MYLLLRAGVVKYKEQATRLATLTMATGNQRLPWMITNRSLSSACMPTLARGNALELFCAAGTDGYLANPDEVLQSAPTGAVVAGSL